MAMLQNAVKAHKASLPPSSQSTLQSTIQQTGRQTPLQTQRPIVQNSSQTSLKSAMLGSRPPANIPLPSKQTSFRPPSAPFKRPSQAAGGLAAALHNPHAFKDEAAVIDLTQSPETKSKFFSNASSTSTRAASSLMLPSTAALPEEFNIDDFEDDDEIDIDVVYPTPLPSMAPPREPLNTLTGSSLNHDTNIVKKAPKDAEIEIVNPPSSQIPWSSSPLSHFATPPGARARREAQEQKSVPELVKAEVAPEIAQPRVSKPIRGKRSLPWAEAVEDAPKAKRLSPDEDNYCFSCRGTGHRTHECLATEPITKLAEPIQTPVKEKTIPWNVTASALKEQQREAKSKFKQQLVKKKQSTITVAEMRSAVSDSLDLTRNGEEGSQIADEMMLSDEQQKVLRMVVDHGKSVFFTGSAGTGKSVLMRKIIQVLKRKHFRQPDRVSVTASTGLAACNIGGMTLHSFAGIGLGLEEVPILVRKIRKNKKAKERWLRTKILIIDEISMVDGALFDKLEAIARTLRNDGRPFGGIQLVITGDFFQLPPVPDRNKPSTFAFDASTWKTSINHTIGLTQVFRQKDPEFAAMLNDMRVGRITPETLETFKSLSRPISWDDDIEATELFPTRNEVENANALKMKSLRGNVYTYDAEDTGKADKETIDRLLSNMMAPKSLKLKKGAQVMLIKNMDDNLVNGSLGTVRAFMDPRTFAVYDADPTILDGTAEEELDENARKAREKLRAMIGKNIDTNRAKVYPLVRFTMADGTHRELLVHPEEWKIELPNGEVQAMRRQVPLILAWALSIHKAQGQTIERVKVDLGKVFEKGQAYVALSRATSKEGLQVLRFDKSKVMAHPKVAEFYNTLYSVEKVSRGQV